MDVSNALDYLIYTHLHAIIHSRLSWCLTSALARMRLCVRCSARRRSRRPYGFARTNFRCSFCVFLCCETERNFLFETSVRTDSVVVVAARDRRRYHASACRTDNSSKYNRLVVDNVEFFCVRVQIKARNVEKLMQKPENLG